MTFLKKILMRESQYQIINYFQYNLVQDMQDKQEQTNISTSEQQSLQISSKESLNHERKDTKTVEISPKMKLIISQIRESSIKRMRRSRQEEMQRSEYNSQVEQMIRTMKINKKTILTNDLTCQDLTSAISAKKLHIEAIVSHNQQKKEKIINLLKILEDKTSLRKNLQESLTNLRNQNRTKVQQLKLFHSLRQKNNQAQQQIISLQQKIEEKKDELSNLSKEVQVNIQKTSQIIQVINGTHQRIKNAKQLQSKLSQTLIQQSKRKIPNQQQMIKCMFLVGILGEQNFVLFLDKKQRGNQKALTQQKSNRFHKIYQNLCKRTIVINTKNSEIVDLRILTSIYMHCKSLTLANLVTTMNTLSFFSQQFQTIYHYKQYLKYVKILMEKMKFNSEWERMKSSMDLITKDLPTYKKQLILFVKQEDILLLNNTLNILLIENEHIVNLGNLKMKLKIELIQGAKIKTEVSQQQKRLGKLSIISQENKLHFEFQH